MPAVQDDSEEYDMGVRLISAAVGIVIAVIILILHNTILLKLAIAAVTLLMLFELFQGRKMSQAAADLHSGFYLRRCFSFFSIRIRFQI
mgnify:CR=1 FL=1